MALPAPPEADGLRNIAGESNRTSKGKLDVEEEAYFDSDEGDTILLEDLHNDLAYLRSRAVAVCRRIDQVLARTAPMNKLPIELLSRVFELGSYRDLLFATTVDAVCQSWHPLARKLPSIWGNIVLNEQWKHGVEAFQRILNQCLTRSGRSPILVDLDLYPIETVEVAQSLLAAIAPHTARYYSFSISVPQPEWIDLIGQHFGSQLAAKMESMAMRFKPTSPWAAAYVQSTVPQGTMPLLYTLTLEGLPLTVLNVSLPGLRVFEYKQFEELYSYPLNAAAVTPIDDLWHVLGQAPNIEDLRVEYSSFSIPDEDLIGDIACKVTLPRLKSLIVGHVDARVAHVLMQAIEAPKLDKLIVRCDPMRHHQDAWFIPTRWAGNLNTLILDGLRILDGSLAVGLTLLEPNGLVPCYNLMRCIPINVTLPDLKTLTAGHVDAGFAHPPTQVTEAPEPNKPDTRRPTMRRLPRLALFYLSFILLYLNGTLAAFTHQGIYRFDRIEYTRIGVWCWRPGPEAYSARTCVDPALSSALTAHVNNKQGSGLSIQYFDRGDGSVLGGPYWGSWNDTTLPVILCLTGQVEGVEGLTFRTMCLFSNGDDDFSSPSVHNITCSVNEPQRRVTDSCYHLPKAGGFNLSAQATSILTVVGIILGVLSCKFFPGLGQWVWNRWCGKSQSAQADVSLCPLAGSGSAPSDSSTARSFSPVAETHTTSGTGEPGEVTNRANSDRVSPRVVNLAVSAFTV